MLDLIKILEESYPTDLEKGEDKTHRISPTRLLKCQRGAFFESIGYKEPLSPQSHQNFEYGIMRHKIIQDTLLKEGHLRAVEEEITWDDPPLLGFVDGRLDTDEGDAVLEIKTTAEKPAKITEPLYTHGLQAQLYMHITGMQQAYLLYESKQTKQGSNPWTVLYLKYDESVGTNLLRKGKKLFKNLQARRIPMPDNDCFYCKNPACFDRKIQKEEELKGYII